MMFPNLWSGYTPQTNTEIRPVDSLSGLHHRALQEAMMLEAHLEYRRKRILHQLKEVANDKPLRQS